MLREEAKGLWEVIKAFGEGKVIQFRLSDSDYWTDTDEESMLSFENGVENYRIKPTKGKEDPPSKTSSKSCRPFEDTAELILHYQKHFHTEYPSFYEPLIWVKRKDDDVRQFITGFGENVVQFAPDYTIPLDCLFEDYVFLDGSICGVNDEEPEDPEEEIW